MTKIMTKGEIENILNNLQEKIFQKNCFLPEILIPKNQQSKKYTTPGEQNTLLEIIYVIINSMIQVACSALALRGLASWCKVRLNTKSINIFYYKHHTHSERPFSSNTSEQNVSPAGLEPARAGAL